jgi:hypothetical protein
MGRSGLLRALELQPGFWPASGQLLLLELLEGRVDAADALLRKERAGWPFDLPSTLRVVNAARSPDSIPPVLPVLEQWSRSGAMPGLMVASFYALLNQPDAAIATLETGVRRRDPLVVHLRWWPAFRSLHSDPGFRALLARLALPPLD